MADKHKTNTVPIQAANAEVTTAHIRAANAYSVLNAAKLNLWPDEMVYKIYCRDKLETLPLIILQQMREHLDTIIKQKEEEQK